MGYRQIICPTCGRGIGLYHREKIKVKSYKVAAPDSKAIPFLDYLARKYDLGKPYFAVEQDTGYEGFSEISHLKPEDWPEGYESAKEAILRGLLWWKRQGWISTKEILDALS